LPAFRAGELHAVGGMKNGRESEEKSSYQLE
jgi:hypothetical protein